VAESAASAATAAIIVRLIEAHRATMATIERQWSDLLSALFMLVPISDLAIRCGIYLAAFAAFSINGAAELWRTFTLETGGGSGGLTHPSSPERSARAMLVVVDVRTRNAMPSLYFPTICQIRKSVKSTMRRLRTVSEERNNRV